MNYAALAKQVKKQIDAVGALVTLRKRTQATFDPAAGTYSSDSTTDYTVRALLKVPDLVGSGDRFRPDSSVREGGLVAIMPSSGLVVTPAAGDLLIVEGVPYTVISNKPLFPGGTVLLHKVECAG